MLEKRIIGICGLKGSGKSTLMKQIPGEVDHIYFAKALKHGLEAMGVPPEALYSPEHKELPCDLLCGRTGRHAMITLGTEWGRDMIGPDFWVNLWHKAVQESKAKVVICDDVRFKSELDAIRQYPNYQLVAVVREGSSLGEHRSEQLLPGEHDIPTLVNDSTPEALYQKYLAL